MGTKVWAAVVFTIAAVVLMLGLPYLDIRGYSGIFKMTASTGFLLTAYFAGAFRLTYGRVLFAGLVFSWFGDLFLIYRGQNFFLAGLISFFIAHVMYCVAYLVYARKPLHSGAALVVLAVPAFLLARWLWPGIPGELQIPVVAYMTVISLMVALGVAAYGRPGGTIIIIGAVMFYLSDIFVARGRFVTSDVWNGLIGLPLYFGGQLFLAVSIALVVQGMRHAPPATGDTARIA